MPKIIKPISMRIQSLNLLSFKMSSATSLNKDDGIPYQNPIGNRFTSSFYTFTTMTPITSHLSDESITPVIPKSISFTSSPGLVSKYLDDCESYRCTSATPILVRASLEQLIKETNSSMLSSGSTPFMSSPSTVDMFLDECEADRECDSPFGMASPSHDSEHHCLSLIAATAKRPKPLPRRIVLLRGQRI